MKKKVQSRRIRRYKHTTAEVRDNFDQKQIVSNSKYPSLKAVLVYILGVLETGTRAVLLQVRYMQSHPTLDLG